MTAARILSEAMRRGIIIRQHDESHIEVFPLALLHADPAFAAKVFASKAALLELLRYKARCVAQQTLCGEFDCGVGMIKAHVADQLWPYRADPIFRAALARLQLTHQQTKENQ